MVIAELLQEVARQTVLAVPLERYPSERIVRLLGWLPDQSPEAWLVPCTHHLRSPATAEEVAAMERALNLTVPDSVQQFLQLTNGAAFYVTGNDRPRLFPGDSQRTRYFVFGTDELVDLNRELLRQFKQLLGHDAEFKDVAHLNYVAFCDAHDGNFLAVLTEGTHTGHVFFLNHEYLFRPYSELDADLYYTVAESLEAWLKLLIDVRGWNGFGSHVPPL